MFKLNKSITLQWLADRLGLEYTSSHDSQISYVCTFTSICPDSLVFSKSDEKIESDCVVIAPYSSDNENLIKSNNPRLDFIRAIQVIDSEIGFVGNDSLPNIHPTAQVGQNVVIENGVTIGENTIIEHNSVIQSGTVIGQNCLIRSNASIGGDGFGFERDSDGVPIKFVHLGGVLIGNNVEVGSSTCIAKGTLGNTIIENNVKIDNLVHIAHNCIIRDSAFIIACAEVSGGVEIGARSWIAPNSSITQKVSIGEGSLVGLGAVVTKNVDNYTVIAGNPAKKIRSLKI